jgi:ParB-like chromosome segregation protein Spo0J
VSRNRATQVKPRVTAKKRELIADAPAPACERFATKLGKVRHAPLSSLSLNEHDFQIRDFDANTRANRRAQGYQSAKLIEELVGRIRENGTALDALVVFPCPDGCFEVVDGHHRYRAYSKTLAASTEIPVQEFLGTRQEARMYAVLHNGKSRLNMTDAERMEAAWRLIALAPALFTGRTQRAIATELSVSATSINRMLKKRGELEEAHGGPLPSDHEVGRWKEMDRLRFDDEARERLDKEREAYRGAVVDALSMKFGKTARSRPEDFSAALKDWFDSLRIGYLTFWLGEPVDEHETDDEF